MEDKTEFVLPPEMHQAKELVECNIAKIRTLNILIAEVCEVQQCVGKSKIVLDEEFTAGLVSLYKKQKKKLVKATEALANKNYIRIGSEDTAEMQD